MNHNETRLFNRATLGLDFEEFRDTRIGQHLLELAAEYKRQALDQLAKADPEDPKQIRVWQNQVQVSDMFVTWLDAAITDGRNAHEQLKLDEAEEIING